ncbi:MSMEG_6728 family protein [Kribbella sp. DT2]|uniref:MSMEG_6728 family protein n=1 Tax=Kribbella sp. DT2 TaxID=3393427 RepID=UPI003CE7EB95
MQSYLPYADFRATARVLDARRLGRQRVDTIQLLHGLTVTDHNLRHHPAVTMWAGYEEALVRYGVEICAAWTAPGRADTSELTLRTELRTGCGIHRVRTQRQLADAGELPPWLGDEDFHRSQRSALLQKNPAYYGRFFDDPADLPVIWPTSDRNPRGQRDAPS